MSVNAVFQAALSATPYPVTQRPVTGTAPVYLTFFEVLGRQAAYSSNRAGRVRHIMQVDIFSRQPAGPETAVVFKALAAAGVRVQHWGPADYEADTHWHHLPITCEYTERTEAT